MSHSASCSSSRTKSSAKSLGDSSGRQPHVNINDAEAPFPQPVRGGLHRGLSARQVQMIAIAGTIGTGLFLGTGRSLAQGGPASMLICYGIVGFIVYVTLLLLGEMATQYPVAGVTSFFIFRQRANNFHLSKGHLTPMQRAFFRRLMVSRCRGTIGSMMQCLLPLISLLPSWCYNSGRCRILGWLACFFGCSLYQLMPFTSKLTENWVSNIDFLSLSKMELTPYGRVLAFVPEGRDYRGLYHRRYPRQCRRQRVAYLYRNTQLAHSWRSVRWWLWWLCQGFRDS